MRALLGIGEGGPDVVGAGERNCSEHVPKGSPDCVRSFQRRYLNEHFLGEIPKKVCDYLLILDKPGSIGGVRQDLILAFFVLGHEGFGRLLNGFIKIPKQPGAHDL